MKYSDILICVFSYNMGVTLENCLKHIEILCNNIDTVIIDDASTDEVTQKVLDAWKPKMKDVFINLNDKRGRKHGNLYDNVQKMCEYAEERGYRYLFLVQDDMQFVRPLTDIILKQYTEIFESSEKILQVDPRFMRRGSDYQILKDIRSYKNAGTTSYADVGIIDLWRLKESGWTIAEGERTNRDGLAALGYTRVFPFTPVIAHVPFPQRYRNGKRKRSAILWNRGKYGFHVMTDEDIVKMDTRDITELPIFRKLKVRNMILSRILYWLKKDSRVLA